MNKALAILIGPDGTLRLFWRAVLFFVIGTWAVFPLVGFVFQRIGDALGVQPGLTAGAVGLGEIQNFVVALLCTLPFALYERRRPDDYGLRIERALSWQTLEGTVAGFLIAGGVALGMILLGGMQVKGLALHGSALFVSAFAWLGAMLWAGLAEEYFYRSYVLQTLWKSVGFWPASLLIALVFAADHYFYKEGENVWDVITLVSFSLVICYSVLRTGSLWFGVGLHFAFDYGQIFVIGTPNGSRIPEGRLLDATLHGPAWLTGGVLGTEASVLIYPLLALCWLYVWWRYRPGEKALSAR